MLYQEQPGMDGKGFLPCQSPQQQQSPNNQLLNLNMDSSSPQRSPQEQFYGRLFTDAALSCGKKMIRTGQDMVDRRIEQSGLLSSIRHYFDVDHNFVANKLAIILFPFHHRDWSRQYTNSVPAIPKFDVNSPDLYIPLMSYITYLFVAGLVFGIQNRFDIEILGRMVSHSIACIIIEIGIQLLVLYATNIPNNLNSIELIAFAGYKFVGIIISVLLGISFNKMGYYAGLIYCSSSCAYFMVRTLRLRILSDYDIANSFSTGFDDVDSSFSIHSLNESFTSSSDLMEKRQLYFLALVALCQPSFMWWFSFNLVA